MEKSEKKVNVRAKLVGAPMLATSPNNEEIFSEYIASKGPDAKTREEEVAALGVDEVADKGKTVFPRDEYGLPIMWDYQIKGFFKEAWQFSKQIPECKASAALKAGKKKIDGLVFVEPRQIILDYSVVDGGEIVDLQRPLRAETAQGPRVALACSETVPAGTELEFTVTLKEPSMEAALIEWLEYGRVHGLGCWRNAGNGSFVYEIIDDDGNVIGGNRERHMTAQKAKDEARRKKAEAIREKLKK